MDAGDAAMANSVHGRIQEIFGRIVAAGLEESLFEQSNHNNDAVAFVIASHLKVRSPCRASSVYERLLKSSRPFVAFSARHILKSM